MKTGNFSHETLLFTIFGQTWNIYTKNLSLFVGCYHLLRCTRTPRQTWPNQDHGLREGVLPAHQDFPPVSARHHRQGRPDHARVGRVPQEDRHWLRRHFPSAVTAWLRVNRLKIVHTIRNLAIIRTISRLNCWYLSDRWLKHFTTQVIGYADNLTHKIQWVIVEWDGKSVTV